MKLPDTFYNGPEILTTGSRNFVEVEFFTKGTIDNFLADLSDLLLPLEVLPRSKVQILHDEAMKKELARYSLKMKRTDLSEKMQHIDKYRKLLQQAETLLDIKPKDLADHVELDMKPARKEPVIKLPKDVYPTVLEDKYLLVINSRAFEDFTIDFLQIEVRSGIKNGFVSYKIGRSYDVKVYPKPRFPRDSQKSEYRAVSLCVRDSSRLLNTSEVTQNLPTVVQRLEDWLDYEKYSSQTFNSMSKNDLSFDDVMALAGFSIQR